MNPVSDKQLAYIRSLAAERTVALAERPDVLSRVVETTRDASVMIDLLKALPRDPRPVDPDEQARIEALRAAVARLSTQDARFALSLLSQYDERGSLSERQWPHVERLAAGPAPTVDLDEGVYVLDDGTMITVYRTKRGFLAGKVWDGSSWAYETGAQRRAGAGRKITADEAAAFGHATGCCVYCARDLTDDRSVEVGYGPVCAAKHDLPWGETATV